MLKRTTYGAACALLIASAATAQDADTVVATVGETEITLGEMIVAKAQLPEQYQQFPEDVLFQGVLDQLIQQQLFADSLGDTPARVEYTLANERRALLAGEAINDINADVVTEEAVQAAYDAMFADADAEAQTEWNASHLLVETEEEALAAQERVEGGEDFADVARDVSTGPSGPSGGELGWFGPGQMVGEFETAVTEMEPGDVSGPVQTQFGWHIVKLNDQRMTEQPTLDEVRPQLQQQVREEAVTVRLEELRAEADVTMPEDDAFDPSIISNLDLLEPTE
ncbi:MAG: peptidylprolyl isomerase [Paracoccaceae bacterium]|nr:peptidylprolyl isomerase [Loktanella sp.]